MKVPLTGNQTNNRRLHEKTGGKSGKLKKGVCWKFERNRTLKKGELSTVVITFSMGTPN